MYYSKEDEIVIDDAWQDLKRSCNKICKGEDDWNLINRAFFLAKEAHQGVRRRSGEPYLLHPIAVAKIVIEEIGLGVKSVIAALLHDVVEDTDYTIEDIERIFGHKIASMVDGLTKMSGVFNADTSAQAEYFRKVLLTLSDDVRVILIKIADRLHNMRTLGYMPKDKQIKITGETIHLFAPLAYRLGLFPIKSELEDLCMKYRFPDEYNEIQRKIEETEPERQQYINKFCEPIHAILQKNGIEYEISGRIKSIYSIWSKMQRKQISFDEIYDLFAIRIVFKALPFPSEKTQCWQIYSSITDIYAPKPDRLRDWISMPKANGYEALHSTDALSGSTENAVEFLDNFKLSLYTSEITVFTPKGEQRKLPFGATALDFAYDIHTKIGNKAIGAKINHKIEPVTKQINSGDQIEIITADNASPKPEWIDIVITTKAKQAIASFLKREREDNISHGLAIFEEKLAQFDITLSGSVLRKVMQAYGCRNKDELYSKIGAGIISLDNIEKIIKSSSASKILKFWKLWRDSKPENGDEEGSDASEITSNDDQFAIASCCNPLPGDSVVGFKDPMTGKIIVHKASCNELNRLASLFGKNIIRDQIRWSQHRAVSYLSTIEIRGIDRMGLLLEISRVVSEDFSINIREVSISSHDGIFEGKISIYVQDADSLNAIMDKFRSLKGVESVKRSIDNKE